MKPFGWFYHDLLQVSCGAVLPGQQGIWEDQHSKERGRPYQTQREIWSQNSGQKLGLLVVCYMS